MVDRGLRGDVNWYSDSDSSFLACWTLKTGLTFEMGTDGAGPKVKPPGVATVDEDEAEACDDDRGTVASTGWLGAAVISDSVTGLTTRARDALSCAIGLGLGTQTEGIGLAACSLLEWQAGCGETRNGGLDKDTVAVVEGFGVSLCLDSIRGGS